ncbi:major facilitator superfamily transporter [Mycolicibacterium neworleansense]|uniref:Major facilitator superfamily transporter n=1 Tax=Mycolicibacterium neworleansense TaxID=146018 RepID=A0A0H5RX97_9MYCO|nr:major facilitator superfamily transporter [Mycolicibacterium neworleansense]
MTYYPPRPPADDGAEHPGMANYPSDETPRRPRRQSVPSSNRWLPPLDEQHTAAYSAPQDAPRSHGVGSAAGERVTVTRAAAARSREMGSRMYGFVHRAATADGADKSGLTALTWPVVANFAVDAAMAVALANTLFFAAASGESKSKVALYLLITIAPFAVIAPLIGPALDRLQHGRRMALAASFALRTVLIVVLIANYDGATGSYPSWVLYPCALGMMVLSKSFSVLRSAVTPRVLPPSIDLVRVNSRLTTFGLLGGTVVGGGIAAGAEYLFNVAQLPGALYVVVAVSVAGAVLAMRIPKWVEVTEGEVPTTLSYHGQSDGGHEMRRHPGKPKAERQPLGRNTITALWGNCTIKVMVGFLFLYPAFVAKSHDASGWEQLLILGLIGAAAGIGNFGGNIAATGGAGRRRGHRRRPGHRADREPAGGRRGDPRHLRRQRHRQGLAGRVPAGRSARSLAGIGVRPVRIGAAAGLGGRRRHRGADLHRPHSGVHYDHGRADLGPGADHSELSRRITDPRPRR